MRRRVMRRRVFFLSLLASCLAILLWVPSAVAVFDASNEVATNSSSTTDDDHARDFAHTKPSPLNTPQTGDFDDLNQLLEGAVVRLPDARLTSDFVILDLYNIRCTNFTVDQVILQSETVQESAHDTFETTHVFLGLEGLDMICYLDYTYEFVFVRSGSADVYSYDNAAAVVMDFARYNLVDSPATLASLEECLPTVNVNDLDFAGDISALVFDTVERLMRNFLETTAENRICDELQSLTTTFIADMLEQADGALAQYYNIEVDPLLVEAELVVPDDVKLMDLRDDSRAADKWLDRILALGVEYGTQIVPDENGDDDMYVNVFLREQLLQNGALVIDLDEFEVLDNHNQFLNTQIFVESVHVYGLDQIQKFEPFLEVGKYTIQNKVTWSHLTVEMYVSITIRASSREDSIFASTSTAGTTENIKISFGVQNINLVLSILLAVDELKLGALQLGTLLHSDKIFDCLLSTIFDVRVSGLSLQAADIQPPAMEGFVARGIDRVVSDLLDASFLIYESALLAAAPGYFDMVVREYVNEMIEEFVRVDVRCFIPFQVGGTLNGFTDFRDLLLPPEEALAAGGMGSQPYGDIPHKLVSQIKEQFLSNDESGSPRINSVIRDALGETSNRTDAVIELGDLLDWNTTMGIASLEALVGVKILNASISNLDSFGSPLELIAPVNGEANMLNNSISVGAGSKPVRFTARVLISATDGDGLQLHNELAVQLDLGGAALVAVVFLQILEDPLFSVPIEDTLNPNCWLTTILPDAEHVGRDLLQSSVFSLDQLLLNISCVSCTSPEFGDLIYGLYSPEEVGNATSKVLNLLSLLRESDFLRVTTDTVLNGASKQCPHTPDFDPDFSYSSLFVESGGDEFRQNVGTRDAKVKYFNLANALVTAFVILIFLCVRIVARHRYRVWKNSITDEAQVRLAQIEQREVENETELSRNTKSMFRSQDLPSHIRMLVPVGIVATIGIQFVAHFALLSYLDIEGQIAGEAFVIHRFLEFQFVDAALRSYRNGGKEMGLLLFIFTGIWPYVKLVTCLVLWFMPPRRISVSRRGTLLMWLDVFAKLSMVDIIATLLVVAAFLVYVGGVSEQELSSGEFFATRIIVVPCAGFYCIVIAQRLTRISSTYILNWHQQIIESFQKRRLVGLGEKDIPSLETLRTFGLSGEVSNDSWEEEAIETNPQEETFPTANLTSEIRSNEGPTSATRSAVETPMHRKKNSWVRRNGMWVRETSELFDDEESTSSEIVPTQDLRSLDRTCDENVVGREMERHPAVLSSTVWTSDRKREQNCAGMEENAVDETAKDTFETEQGIDAWHDDENQETPQNSRMRRIAIGMTGMTVFILVVIGCILAPSISIDAKTLWGLFESGKTFEEVVSDYTMFRVVCSILVEARLILDSVGAKTSLGIMLALAVLSAAAFPLLKGVEAFREWKKQRVPRRENPEVPGDSREAGALSWTVLLLARSRRLCARGLGMVRNLPRTVRSYYDWCKGEPYQPMDCSDLDLLPAFQMKAWRHMEVYVCAFVIAIWQLGAVAIYVLHQYCTLLEMSFETLVFLGLIEDSEAECFETQASSPSFIFILTSAFCVLMLLFFVEAIGHYRRVVAAAKQELESEGLQK